MVATIKVPTLVVASRYDMEYRRLIVNHFSVNLISVSAGISVNAGFIFAFEFQKNCT